MKNLTPFSLERAKRNVIYNNLILESIKNKYTREQSTPFFNVENPSEKDKNHETYSRKEFYYKISKNTEKHLWKIISVLLTDK